MRTAECDQGNATPGNAHEADASEGMTFISKRPDICRGRKVAKKLATIAKTEDAVATRALNVGQRIALKAIEILTQ